MFLTFCFEPENMIDFLRGTNTIMRFRNLFFFAMFPIRLWCVCAWGDSDLKVQPNVILIMTDDQGYGDVGIHGNAQIRTPNMDRIAGEGVRLEQFHVCPVCSPTRASLMTGRYNYRTRAIDTYIGRSMMDPDETTIAEIMSAKGYRTGIFGKWHLGDNYPLRAMDQGFDESLVHGGGGLTQPGDYPGNHYHNPTLLHNGKFEATEGYCSDVYTTALMKFIDENRERPFFAYLPFNAPHTPLEVPEEWVKPYRDQGLDETMAKIYAMVTNIDDNLGRLDEHLKKLGLFERTMLIFLTDNGPHQDRYRSGMHGLKGTVYEGGTRVPCFIRYPGHLEAGKITAAPAAHFDLMPTILEVCGVEMPGDLKIDGMSLWSHLTQGAELPERSFFFQWHRGDVPEMYQACAMRRGRYKLVQSKYLPEVKDADQLPWELYDLEKDPAESKNLAEADPKRLMEMREAYRKWFEDVSSTRGYDPPRIILGHDRETESVLTWQDWRGPKAGWGRDGLGHWAVHVERPKPGEPAAKYDVRFRFTKSPEVRTATLVVGETSFTAEVAPNGEEVKFEGVELPSGDQQLEGRLTRGDKLVGPNYIYVLRK